MRSSDRILVSQDTLTEMGQAIMRGVISAARTRHGWKVYKCPMAPREIVLERLGQSDFRGAIVHAAGSRLVDDLVTRSIPVVSTSNAPPEPRLPLVCSDDLAAGRMAARYLRDRGFEQIVYVGSLNYNRYARQRLAGAREELGDEAVHLLRQDDGQPDWREACLELIRSSSDPVALLCSDDRMGETVCEWAEEMGFSVPRDCVIMGFNNEQLRCELARPGLTSVELPFEQVGVAAVAKLAAILDGTHEVGSPDITTVPPLGVVERPSTAIGAIEDAATRRAVAEIRERYGRVTVEQLLEFLPVSRRALELGFKRCLGQTPHQYILRTRGDHARRLLGETTMTVTEIAHTCGFSGPTQMGVVFRRLYDLSPTQVRRQFIG
jgi:LacI family transcriptional regulator